MDLTGIIGLILGLGFVVFGAVVNMDPFSIDFSKMGNFVDISSVLITLGGTIAATMCCFPMKAFASIPKHFGIMYKKNKYNPKEYIATIVDFAQSARRKGILSLEDKVAEQTDPFMKKSVMLIVDAIEPAKTIQILEDELDSLDDRHLSGVKIYEKASSLAPAFGMIGTLIGLVNMLANLDLKSESGAAELTGGMAVALITTFYGSLVANLFLTPWASKLRVRHAEEMLCKQIVVQGVTAIQSGDNPKNIEERLLAFLPASERSAAASGEGGDGDEGDSSADKKGKKGKKK
ncbi:MAG: MotA/TolQ/ExbB proton channel family protein [Oscillospiraceae bacterium]